MVDVAVDLHPALARGSAECGHGASGHGQTWSPQYSMTPEQERESCKQNLRPSRTRGTEEFIEYAQRHLGVAFMCKDESARFALNSPLTVRERV